VSISPASMAARDLESMLHPQTHLGQHHRQGPMMLARAEGVYMYDDQGRQYLEGLAGLWCTSLGYGNEELARAAYDQMKKLSYAQLFASKSHEVGVLLAEKLKAMVPLHESKVFFGNSGSDANDTQIKLVWYYNNVRGRPYKKKIIGRIKGYHGITLASGSLTGLAMSHKGFDLPLAGGRFLHTDLPHHWRAAEAGESEEDYSTRLAGNLERLILKEGPDTVAAFIAEPIMGAGGVILPPRTYFEKVQAVLAKYDVLFIDDEVICGFGRTGQAFGADTFGLRPDSISLAKALTSAYQPLSAVVIKDEIYQAFVDAADEWGPFGHGFTYSGHPVACAVGLKTLEIYERDRLFEHVARLAPQFQERLQRYREHPLVGEVRGIGLIGAVELVADKRSKRAFEPAGKVGAECLNQCHANGLICRAIGDVMAFCPPLVITSGQVDELFDKFDRALAATLAWANGQGLLAA
jgi:4-aminobutyrate---pyruvate transaminase